MAYVPYLLTGDRYYAEEMAFWANYSMLRTYPADGVRGSDGILANNEVRGYAWALRNIVDAAAYYPDSPVRDYLAQKVQANLQWLDAYANAQDPITNPFRILWTGYRPEPGFIALWEQNYLAYAIDRAAKQGFSGGLAHRDAIARLQLRLFTSEPEYPRSWGAPSPSSPSPPCRIPPCGRATRCSRPSPRSRQRRSSLRTAPTANGISRAITVRRRAST